MADFLTLDDIAVADKTVLVRLDLNVPMQNGQITDMTRIAKSLPTVRELAGKKAKVVILSHLGRPRGVDASLTLKPVAQAVAGQLGTPCTFVPATIGATAQAAVQAMQPGDVLMLENVRFHAEEEANAPAFAKTLAALGDIYVNDAFSTAHRAHASTEGLAHHLPAVAGRLMQAELQALAQALTTPERPVLAIVGGSKVSSKIDLLNNLVTKVDAVAIGGGMANTFLYALGKDVGKSLCERDLADTARTIMAKADAAGCRILLPQDVVAAQSFAAHALHQTVTIDAVPDDAMILDIGAITAASWVQYMRECKTVVWNGPAGAFEMQPFDQGTMAIARAIVDQTQSNSLVSVAGGGDTIAALVQAEAMDALTFVSTAGGAFLEWLEGKTLPGVAALQRQKTPQRNGAAA